VEATAGTSLRTILEAARKDGLCEAHLYAIEKTGKVITQQNAYMYPKVDLEAWDAAISEYRMPADKANQILLATRDSLIGADPEELLLLLFVFATNVAYCNDMSEASFRAALESVLEKHKTVGVPLR
jgi:hypothetical protein